MTILSPYHITNPQEFPMFHGHFPIISQARPLHQHLRHQIRGRALAVARHEGHSQRSRLRSLAVPAAIQNIDSTRLLNNV